MQTRPARRKGRGATVDPPNRYAAFTYEPLEAQAGHETSAAAQTTLSAERSRRIISRNTSPDVGFDRSVNPYRGCEHGCIYCYARPTHAWLGLSPGLDFETRLFYKPDAARLLREALAAPGYRCAPIALGVNTDAYQPAERRLRITRALLEVLVQSGHPFALATKSALIERDIDLIREAAARGRAAVAVSITTLDAELSRRLEPRAAAPQRRLKTIARLAEHGIAVGVLVAPVIPVLTDPELERILEAARRAGARHAAYVLLRLPQELKALFTDWLERHAPLKAAHVLNAVRATRGGRMYDARFGARMSGTGVYAALIRRRFDLACKRLGFAPAPALDCRGFRPPRCDEQLSLF